MRLLSLCFAVSLLTLTACPKPLPPKEEWQPVEGAPASRSLFSEEQLATAKRYKMKAHLNKMRAAFVTDTERACASDDECVLTPMHCCTCASGGQSLAVHKEKLPDVIKRRGLVCDEYDCPQVVSSHPSCEAESAVCKAGRCEPAVPEGAGAPAVKTEPIPDEPDTP